MVLELRLSRQFTHVVVTKSVKLCGAGSFVSTEINATLNSRRGNLRQQEVTQLKLTRFFEIRVDFIKR